MRIDALAFIAGLSVLPVSAQVRTPEFSYAEAAFNGYDLRVRVIGQVLLIASGYQNSVPTEQFGLRTYTALKRFQVDNNLPPDGMLTKATSDRLFAIANPMLNMWGFRLVSHPLRGRPIWVPQGMGLQPQPNKNGLSFQDPQGRVRVAYNYFAGSEISDAYRSVLDKARIEGFVVHYSVLKDDWFVVSRTSPNGQDQYLRYHQDGSGIVGFSLFWNNAQGNVSGERIAILMSASLGSVMNGRPMIEPPGMAPSAPQVAAAPPVQAAARSEALPAVPSVPASPAAPVPPVTPKAEEKGISAGTGFFVDNAGTFVTNAHVIKDCKTVAVRLNDNKPAKKARILATDTNNDLALLKLEEVKDNRFASVRPGVRLGENVAAFGYPHTDILATSGNFTLGNITALAGIGDDSRYYQISTPVQQGNSGGPLLDSYGNVVGVVAAKLNVLKMAAASGDFAQNVNFAIKSNTLTGFLESNQITAQFGNTSGAKLDPADLADAAKAVSGFVACQ